MVLVHLLKFYQAWSYLFSYLCCLRALFWIRFALDSKALAHVAPHSFMFQLLLVIIPWIGKLFNQSTNGKHVWKYDVLCLQFFKELVILIDLHFDFLVLFHLSPQIVSNNKLLFGSIINSVLDIHVVPNFFGNPVGTVNIEKYIRYCRKNCMATNLVSIVPFFDLFGIQFGFIWFDISKSGRDTVDV